jgi:hypothetical protein
MERQHEDPQSLVDRSKEAHERAAHLIRQSSHLVRPADLVIERAEKATQWAQRLYENRFDPER